MPQRKGEKVAATECVFEGCDKPTRRRGYCNGHYTQIMRGKPLTPLQKRTPRTGTCSFEGCGYPENRWGLCAAHVAQRIRGNELTPVQRLADIPDTCTVEGCDAPHRSKGFCNAHYAQTLRGELPSNFIPLGLSPAERAMTYAKRRDSGCWGWGGPVEASGYAIIRVGERPGRIFRAHRVMWEHFHGPIPEGKVLDHMCGTRECTRPDHMRVATPQENSFNLTVLSKNNTSGYRGVSRHIDGVRWVATVTLDGVAHHLGVFDTAEDADRVASAFRSEHMGLWNGPRQRHLWPRYRTGEDPAAVTDDHLRAAIQNLAE